MGCLRYGTIYLPDAIAHRASTLERSKDGKFPNAGKEWGTYSLAYTHVLNRDGLVVRSPLDRLEG